MKKMIMGLTASLVLAMAPVSAALAESTRAMANEVSAKAWIPATASEQIAARGGISIGWNNFPLPSPVGNIQIQSSVTFVACFVTNTTGNSFGLRLYCRNDQPG